MFFHENPFLYNLTIHINLAAITILAFVKKIIIIIIIKFQYIIYCSVLYVEAGTFICSFKLQIKSLKIQIYIIMGKSCILQDNMQ